MYVAGGSNIAAAHNSARAARELHAQFPGARFSACYANAAVGFDGDEFINFVVALATTRTLSEVLQVLHDIEASCGRPRAAPRWAPRSMDLDVLLYDDVVLQTAQLILPRPDLLKRPYMLGPLAAIAPELRHPTDGRSMAALWAAFDRDAHPLRRLALDLNVDAGAA